MGHKETHALLHGYFNERQFDRMDEHMRESMTYEDVPRGLTMKSRDEFKDWLRDWATAFSDARVDAASYSGGDDFSLARFRGRGRNDGPMGPLPATNRDMDNPFWEILEYDADGKVVSAAIHYDQVTLLSQLGHIQPPG
jgi:SnoaL-like polyketide cyclase